MLVLLLHVTLIGSVQCASAQDLVPACASYKNQEAATQKIRAIDVYDQVRKVKMARYEFDQEGYLLRFDTLLDGHDTFPSRKTYVHYSNERTLVIDSTIHISASSRIDRPVHITTIQCTPGSKEIRDVRYNLTDRFPWTRLFHFNSDDKCDTIYVTDSGRKDVETYFTHNLIRSNDIILIHKSSPAYQKYEEYHFNTSKKIVYYNDHMNEHKLAYNADGLLVEQTTYVYPPFSLNMYAKGKRYDSYRTVYEYKGNKLQKATLYPCNRELKTRGLILYEQASPGYVTEYAYTSTGLLRSIKSKYELITYKYDFYK